MFALRRVLRPFFCLALLCFALGVTASPRVCSTQESPFLWKVASPQGGLVWLFGSIHYADSSFYPLALSVQKAFAASPALAVELQMDDPAVQAEAAKKTLVLGALPAGQTLDALLGMQEWGNLQKTFQKLGVPAHAFLGYRPWLVVVQLTQMALMQTGFNPAWGVDLALLTIARQQKKEVRSLETVEAQLLAVADVPDSEQVALLRSTIGELDTLDKQIESIKRTYKCGDTRDLARVLEEFNTGTPRMKELLLQRNVNMADSVASYLTRGDTVFVTVGAAHLVGEGSVVDLLKAKGFQVEKP
jgi:uncharacterized protein YbaP (TraB family)